MMPRQIFRRLALREPLLCVCSWHLATASTSKCRKTAPISGESVPCEAWPNSPSRAPGPGAPADLKMRLRKSWSRKAQGLRRAWEFSFRPRQAAEIKNILDSKAKAKRPAKCKQLSMYVPLSLRGRGGTRWLHDYSLNAAHLMNSSVMGDWP